MRTVYKYPFEVTDYFNLEMPQGAEILTVQTQGGERHMWALVDPVAPKELRAFRLAGTGHPINDLDLQYVATFQLKGGLLVFHLFELNGRPVSSSGSVATATPQEHVAATTGSHS
jgi:hypothetical protein